MEELQIRLYQRKFRQGSKKSLPGCKRMPEIKSEMLITSRKYLNPSIKISLKTSKASLEPISGLDIHYVAIRRALKSQSSRPAIEQKQAKAEQAAKGAQTQTESHKEMLTNLQSALELKIARKTALETELRNLSSEIEADEKKIAELPGLIEKTQKEASSAITEENQFEAELTVLSNIQRDYQERMKSINQTISNASNVIAK
jgi:chromosome segregation ATPase